MRGREGQHEGAEQVGTEHAARHWVELAALGPWSLEQSGDEEECGERKARRGVEGMRR
jgi:hypothetical protein